MTGEGSGLWNLGFDGGLNGFYRVTPNVLCGLRFSYNRWAPDEDEITGNLGYAGIHMSVSGSQSVIEIAPALRLLAPVSERSPITVLGQVGVGLYLVRGNITIEATYSGWTETFEYYDRSENAVGISFGAGIEIDWFEIVPLFTTIVTEEESTLYYSINAGASFSF